MQPGDERLRSLLREWRNVPAPSDGLADEVARTIAVRGGRGDLRGWLERWMRPELPLSWVAGCVAAGIVLGVAGVEWRNARQREREAQAMPVRYLLWIDPVSAKSVTAVMR